MAGGDMHKRANPNTLAIGAFLEHRHDMVWPTGSAKITPTSKYDDKGYIKSPAPAKQLDVMKLKAAYAENPLRTFASKEARDLKNKVVSFNETERLRERVRQLGQDNQRLALENMELRQKLEAHGIPEKYPEDTAFTAKKRKRE